MNYQLAPAGLHCFQQHQFSSTLKLTESAWESRYWQLDKIGKKESHFLLPLIQQFMFWCKKKLASQPNFILSDVRFSCQVPLLVTRRGDTFLLTKLPASEACIHHSRRICTWFADARTAAPWCKATGFQSRELWLIVSGDSIPKGSLYTVCLYMFVHAHHTHIYIYIHRCRYTIRWYLPWSLEVVSVLKTSTQTRVCMQTFPPCS